MKLKQKRSLLAASIAVASIGLPHTEIGQKSLTIAKDGFKGAMLGGGEIMSEKTLDKKLTAGDGTNTGMTAGGQGDVSTQAEATTIDDATIAQVDPTATAVVV